MNEKEFQERDQRARKLVEKAHASLRRTPLQAIFPKGIRRDVLLGTEFTVTYLNYVNNTGTFSLREATK